MKLHAIRVKQKKPEDFEKGENYCYWPGIEYLYCLESVENICCEEMNKNLNYGKNRYFGNISLNITTGEIDSGEDDEECGPDIKNMHYCPFCGTAITLIMRIDDQKKYDRYECRHCGD